MANGEIRRGLSQQLSDGEGGESWAGAIFSVLQPGAASPEPELSDAGRGSLGLPVGVRAKIRGTQISNPDEIVVYRAIVKVIFTVGGEKNLKTAER